MNRVLTTLLAGVTLIGTATAANATTTTPQIITIGVAPASPTNGVLTDWPSDTAGCALYSGCTGTFQTFDTSLGTLQSITVTTSMQIYSSIIVTPVQPTYGSVHTDTELTIGSTNSAINAVLAGLLDVNNATNTSDIVAVDASSGVKSYGTIANPVSTQQTLVTTSSVTSYAPAADTTPSDLQAFATNGPTTQTINFNTLTNTDTSSTAGNTGFVQTTYGVGTFSIFYTYAAPTGVPEPASMALLGAGLVGAGLVRRRK